MDNLSGGIPPAGGAAGLYYVAVLGVILFAARWGVLSCYRSSRLGRGRWVALGGAGSRWGCRWVVVLGGWAWGGAAGAGLGIW